VLHALSALAVTRRAGSRGFVALIEAINEGGANEVRRARKK
jgi:hypothetical protein